MILALVRQERLAGLSVLGALINATFIVLGLYLPMRSDLFD